MDELTFLKYLPYACGAFSALMIATGVYAMHYILSGKDLYQKIKIKNNCKINNKYNLENILSGVDPEKLANVEYIPYTKL